MTEHPDTGTHPRGHVEKRMDRGTCTGGSVGRMPQKPDALVTAVAPGQRFLSHGAPDPHSQQQISPRPELAGSEVGAYSEDRRCLECGAVMPAQRRGRPRKVCGELCAVTRVRGQQLAYRASRQERSGE